MSARTHSRQRSLSNQKSTQPQPYTSKGKENATETPFEPCAATGSLFLYAEGSTVVCLHHDTLAIERKFERHTENIQFICVDNVSERGQGRLVVTYDVGHTAIVWDVMTGDQISRFASYEPLTAAAWMRNGNLTFGNEKGELILFEPATSEHVSARTIFDPVTAIAPSSDCKTFAIGYRNGSILLASLQPTFTILHTLSTSRAPSQITALSWHASSSKQKSDMLATNTVDGDLRVWSVAKPPGSAQPRVIRSLHRSDSFAPSRSWISWSKNGRILQLYEGVTWAWDVRTKDVTYQSIPTAEFIRGIAAYGPTGTLFTLGPNHTIQQYDIDIPQMVANVRHQPQGIPQTPPQAIVPSSSKSGSESDYMSPRRELRPGNDATNAEGARLGTPRSGHRHSNSYGSQPSEKRPYELTSPANKTAGTATTISLGVQSNFQGQPYSPSSSKSARKTSRLRQEVVMSPADKQIPDLFPYTAARLSDVPYQQPRTSEDTNLTPDDLRKQMLNVVFGWQDDIRSLINDELNRHPVDSPNAVFLARWLGSEANQVADAFRSTTSDPTMDWMRLALNSIGNQPSMKKMAQVYTQKLLTQGDVHAAACMLMATGDYNDAIEVYVSRNFHMEAILLTCLLMPSDWQRQSFLVRKWGEHVVQLSQHHLAVRCFSCTGVEPTEPWTSPTAQTATQSLKEIAPMMQPSIYHKTMERRGLQDPSPQSALAPPVTFQVTAPGKPRQSPQDGGLKLITSFSSKDEFRFPGLMSDEGTPINAALVTPIAESALPRSAVSPGGLGSYRMNNMRSLTGALASRTGTPGALHRNRLPSIGETPIDSEARAFPAALVPKAPPTPADSGSDKEKGKSGQVAQDKKVTQAPLPMLLTPARYEPINPTPIETPQTAVAQQSTLSFGDRRPPDIERSASARPRGTSRARKPEGLSVQTNTTHDSQSSQELLLPAVYGDSIQRPATTTAAFRTTRSEISPPNTGNSLASLRSVKTPVSSSGRSLDKYISSLEQAQYYKSSRSRGNSVASKQSRDEGGEKKYKHFVQDAEDGSMRSHSIPVPSAKRSPSSPVPMSPEELRLHSASVESFDSAYSSTSYNNRLESMRSLEAEIQREINSTSEARRRHRSRSRTEGKSQGGSRAASRRRSPEREAGRRGRSQSRKEGSSARSPDSPVPMIPSEEDLQGSIVDPALKFVAQNRQRLHRSSSRRDSSTDRKTRMRSRSRQPESTDTGVSRKSSISMRSERRHRHDDSTDTHQTDVAGVALEASSTSEAERKNIRDFQQLPHGRRKALAQAELEARRLSLTRRPSAPAVPLPGQPGFRTAATDYPPPMLRAQTDQGLITLSSLGSPHPLRPDSAGLGRGRPQTPRAMKHPAQQPAAELPNVGEVLSSTMYQVPTLPDTSVMSPKNGRSGSFTSPEIPFDMPKHPMFDANIATSRPGSQNAHSRGASPATGAARDRRNIREARAEFPVVTIGEEDYSGGEVVYASPAVVPELQHLAVPPPPPPPPLPPPPELSGHEFMFGLRIQTDNLATTTNVPLPQSAYPTDPTTAISPSDRHRREKSINDKQLVGKIRNFVGGRMRSTSRGRSQSRGRDNATRSPNLGGEEAISPYESIQSTQQAHYPLATVTEGH